MADLAMTSPEVACTTSRMFEQSTPSVGHQPAGVDKSAATSDFVLAKTIPAAVSNRSGVNSFGSEQPTSFDSSFHITACRLRDPDVVAVAAEFDRPPTRRRRVSLSFDQSSWSGRS
jgi:hypothetical protein